MGIERWFFENKQTVEEALALAKRSCVESDWGRYRLAQLDLWLTLIIDGGREDCGKEKEEIAREMNKIKMELATQQKRLGELIHTDNCEEDVKS